MIKQVILPILAVMAFIVIVGLYTQGKLKFLFPNLDTPNNLLTFNTPEQEKVVKINNISIPTEIADTEVSREKGLSNRSSLKENGGMLFVFESKPVMANFWMKDMLIPLDIIWIKDSKITKIDRDVANPPVDTPKNLLTIYSSNQPIDYVLEVNSGFTAKNNIKVGDSVILPF